MKIIILSIITAILVLWYLGVLVPIVRTVSPGTFAIVFVGPSFGYKTVVEADMITTENKTCKARR